MQDYRKLQVWQRSHQLSMDIYTLFKAYPPSEQDVWMKQVQHSALAVPSLIAQGSVRETDADFAKALQSALGAIAELDYLLQLAYDLAFLGDDQHIKFADDVRQIRKLMLALIQRLKQSNT